MGGRRWLPLPVLLCSAWVAASGRGGLGCLPAWQQQQRGPERGEGGRARAGALRGGGSIPRADSPAAPLTRSAAACSAHLRRGPAAGPAPGRLSLRGGDWQEREVENYVPEPGEEWKLNRENTSAVDVSNMTVHQRLRVAVRDTNVSLARALIAEGADVNRAERGTHCTVLITACFQNDIKMVDMLLAAGARTDIADEMKMVALHYAAAWGYDLVAERLMAAGADPTKGNMEGYTPREMAEKRGHVHMVEVLDKWLACG